MNTSNNISKASLWLSAVLVAIAIGVLCWAYFVPRPDPAGQVIPGTPAKEVRAEPTEEVMPPAVTVFKSKAPLKKKLDLPAAVVDNDKVSVLASSKVAAGERSHTVTTVLNTETGKAETYVRTDPLPWLALESRGEVGLYYGMKNGNQVIRLQVRQDFIQVKALHVGVIGSVDMISGARPDTFIGVGVAYKW